MGLFPMNGFFQKHFLHILWLLSSSCLVLPPAFAAEAPCENFQSPESVLACAVKNHPEIRQAEVALQQGEALENVAGQRPNLELNSQAVTANTSAGRLDYVEFNLAHTFELGGKRGARIEQAQAARTLTEADLLKAKEQVYLTTLSTLYRLRQGQTELKIVMDALSTFGKIQQVFRSRSRLSPDQSVSLQIIELAEGDYRARRAVLESELLTLNKTLELATGHDLSQNPKVLPARKTNWPVRTHDELKAPLAGSAYRAAQADLRLSEAKLSLEQSLSWPDLKLGPTYEYQSQGLSSHHAFGLNFTLPLPLFHSNGAGRASARYGMNRSEIGIEAARIEVSAQKEILLGKYEGAVQFLKNAPTEAEIARRRKSTQGYFDRGLVSGALVIEAHRQILDFSKSQNEQELTAIESLVKLDSLSGRLFQENL